MPPRFYDRHEAAALLRVSVATVKRLLRSGELSSITIGDRRLIPVEAMEAFINARKAAAIQEGAA